MIKKFLWPFIICLSISNTAIVYATPINVYVTNNKSHSIKVNKAKIVYDEFGDSDNILINNENIAPYQTVLTNFIPLRLETLLNTKPSNDCDYNVHRFDFLLKSSKFLNFSSRKLSLALIPDELGNRNQYLEVRLSEKSKLFPFDKLKDTVNVYVVANDDAWDFYLEDNEKCPISSIKAGVRMNFSSN